MTPKQYFILAAIALLVLVLNLWNTKLNKDALDRIDRNYQRWDDFAKQNPDLKIPPRNGQHP